MTYTATTAQLAAMAPAMRRAIEAFEDDADPGVLIALRDLQGSWRADGWVADTYGYVVPAWGDNAAAAILYPSTVTPSGVDWELDDRVDWAPVPTEYVVAQGNAFWLDQGVLLYAPLNRAGDPLWADMGEVDDAMLDEDVRAVNEKVRKACQQLPWADATATVASAR